jgi:hypothetical protein
MVLVPVSANLGVAVLSAVATTAGSLTTTHWRGACLLGGFVGAAALGAVFAAFVLVGMPKARAGGGRPRAHALTHPARRHQDRP